MIPFTKAHACGNDFLIVTEDAAAGRDWTELTRRLCARNTGIGADGIEFFTWDNSNPEKKSGRIRLHNADGSIAEISGNGTRCVAAWMAEAIGAKAGDTLEVETDAGLRLCHVDAVHNQNAYSVEITTGMGVPKLSPRTVTIPGGVQVPGMEVSTGNPHFVIVVDNTEFAVDGQRWQSIGQQVCGHPDFPYQTNVEFARVLSSSEIEIRIFERGVGPTSSSGTGTSASAAAVISQGLVRSPLHVIAPGGAQTVRWDATDAELELTGPATLIARGEAWEE
ncbi:diaminopimelate epimerase [Terracidiphilus gabretensis]|uniref:diaminopimelate epimerase n=1 Tax=Terracidiphilus gabretensis TaxID=1577687 RepID=UPI00071B9DBC|nr:diaminopimelate epimerase [Terracidiphilus gabretensis]